MSRKIAGKKICGSHCTVIDVAESLVRIAEKNPHIEKISLGIIRRCRTGSDQKNVKFKRIPAGLEVNIRGNSYVQTLYFYISRANEDERIERIIEQLRV